MAGAEAVQLLFIFSISNFGDMGARRGIHHARMEIGKNYR